MAIREINLELRPCARLWLLIGILLFAAQAAAEETPSAIVLAAPRSVKGLLKNRITDAEKPETISQLAFSHDGSRIVSWAGNQVRLWDLKTGKVVVEGNASELQLVAERADLFSMKAEGVTSNVFDMLTGKAKGKWNAPSQDRPPLLLLPAGSVERRQGLPELIRGPAISADGSLMAQASTIFVKELTQMGGMRVSDRLVVGDASTGKTKFTLTARHKPPPKSNFGDGLLDAPSICGLQFSRDGRHLAAATTDGSFTIWEMEMGKEVATYEPQKFGQLTMNNGITPTSEVFVQREAITWLDNHRELIIIADGQFARWKLDANSVRPLGLKPLTEPPPAAKAAGAKAKKKKGKGFPTPKAEPSEPGSQSIGVPQVFAFSPDGRRLLFTSRSTPAVTGGQRAWLMLSDITSGNVVGAIPGIQGDNPWAVAFSPDSQRVAIGTYMGDVLVYKVDTFDKLAREGTRLEGSPPVEMVENPDFTCWKDCAQGTTVEFRATWIRSSSSWKGTVTGEIRSKKMDEIEVVTTSIGTGSSSPGSKSPNTAFTAGGTVAKQIRKDLPMQMPCCAMMNPSLHDPIFTLVGQETIEVGGNPYDCKVYKYEEKGNEKPGILKSGKIWICPDVPGMVVRRRGVQSSAQGPYETEIELVKIVKK